MTDTARHDIWATGAAYERYVGRWSRLVADDSSTGSRCRCEKSWLDVGSGTGALSARVLERCAPARIVGVDSSAGFVAHASAEVADPRAEFRDGDARSLPIGDEKFDAVVSGLVLNFVPDQPKMAAEMRRAARPGGTVALYVWDYAVGMELMRKFWDAAIAEDPAAKEFDEGARFSICDPAALTVLFETAGLRDVASRAIDVPTVFKDFDDYWSPFLGGTGAAPGYLMSRPEPARDAIRERLKTALPAGPNGTIRLTARACAVKGTA